MDGINPQNGTKVGLLYALGDFTQQKVKNLLLPAQLKDGEGGEEPPRRPADVYLTRLPEMYVPTKRAPYILHQVLTGQDGLENITKGTGMSARMEFQSRAVIRTVFCVYDLDGQRGGMELLNLMEELRVALLTCPTLGGMFELDIKEGIAQLVYEETEERVTAPYYIGDMVTVWKLPPVQRLDAQRVIHGLPPMDPKAAHHTKILAKKGMELNDEENH